MIFRRQREPEVTQEQFSELLYCQQLTTLALAKVTLVVASHPGLSDLTVSQELQAELAALEDRVALLSEHVV